MALLREALEVDQDLAAAEYAVKDRQGGTAKIAIWQGTGDDLYGLVARSERIVNTMEGLLGGEVYHWHSKDDHQSAARRWRVGVASGLRLLVPTAYAVGYHLSALRTCSAHGAEALGSGTALTERRSLSTAGRRSRWLESARFSVI